MAYTSVIPVRRLDRAVKYVINKEKTTAVSLQDALDFAANRDKTEQSCFESSYACTLETAFADMRQTKERWHKLGGVQGYHLVQSFAVGEVTPELAHRIAKELADRVLGGRYEYAAKVPCLKPRVAHNTGRGWDNPPSFPCLCRKTAQSPNLP